MKNLAEQSNGRLILIEDYMNPQKSYLYGHAGMASVFVKKTSENEYTIEFLGEKREVKTLEEKNILNEIERYHREQEVRNIFEQKKKDYNNILRLSATTINPYHILSTNEKKRKMEEIMLKNERFDTLEQVDLFLVEIGRVNRFISYGPFGHLEINFYTNRWRDYFVIDKDEEIVVISKDSKEIEKYILKKLKVSPEEIAEC